ncbi:MAG: ATP-grasp domain-containing protein [Spirochaetaceae bacterium]|nr:ATP-grasp domain-containing protein [Spirochaetaceae bacterium]
MPSRRACLNRPIEDFPYVIFILGCSVMQLPALRIAREMGWYVAAADGNPEAEGRSLCHHFFPVDLKDVPALIESARTLRDGRGLHGVFTAGTDFSLSVAEVAEAFGLPGHSGKAARAATDKRLMREAFLKAGVPSPDFIEVGPDDDASACAAKVPGPWVVKPVDSMGARGVVRIDRDVELPEALDAARKYSRSGRALLESYMEGPEYSLDALVENGRLIRCGLADRHITYSPRFIEIGHTIPTKQTRANIEILWDAFEHGVKALGLTHGAAKGDVKLTRAGPMIGEIAARLSGGYMSGWTWPYASDVEPTRGGLRLAVGLDAEVHREEALRVCAERALIGIDGTIRTLNGREEALALPGVKEVFLRYGAGDKLVFPRNNVEKAGNVITVGADWNEAEQRALAALRTLRMELDPRDDTTGVFLDDRTDFPPDAFPLDDTGRFAAYLESLWSDSPPKPSRGRRGEGPLSIQSLPESAADSSCNCHDVIGRTPLDCLEVLQREGFLEWAPDNDSNRDTQTASDFWKALIRGGLAGARWYLERRI